VLCASALTFAVAIIAPASARAEDPPVTATAGLEYYEGPDQLATRTVTGEVEAKVRSGTASLLVGGFNDEGVGAGFKFGGGLGWPISPRTQLKLDGERATGDSSYVAWMIEAGPAFDLLKGNTLSFKYIRREESAGALTNVPSAITNAVSAALESPVIPDKLSATGEVSYVQLQDLGGLEGTAGLSWTPADHFEIEGEAGYSQTGIGLNDLFSAKHAGRSGRGPTNKGGTATETPGPTAQLALRVSFP